MFFMALLLPHRGVDGLSVQPRSDHLQAKGGQLSSFCSKAMRCRIIHLL